MNVQLWLARDKEGYVLFDDEPEFNHNLGVFWGTNGKYSSLPDQGEVLNVGQKAKVKLTLIED